jgi:hypothetical protein
VLSSRDKIKNRINRRRRHHHYRRAANLTADHIIQTALVIAGARGKPGLLTIATSDIAGNPADTAQTPLNSAFDGSQLDFGGTEPTDSTASTSTAPIELADDASSNGHAALPVPEPSTLTAVVIAICAFVILLPSTRSRLDGAISAA